MGWISAAWGIGKGLYSAYKVWFLIVPLAAMIGSGWLYYRNAEQAKERLVLATYQKEQAQAAAKDNGEALMQCIAANQANALDAMMQKGRAEAAERHAAELLIESDNDVEVINREANNFRTEKSCDALTPAFADWVRDNP